MTEQVFTKQEIESGRLQFVFRRNAVVLCMVFG